MTTKQVVCSHLPEPADRWREESYDICFHIKDLTSSVVVRLGLFYCSHIELWHTKYYKGTKHKVGAVHIFFNIEWNIARLQTCKMPENRHFKYEGEKGKSSHSVTTVAWGITGKSTDLTVPAVSNPGWTSDFHCE